jgi:L-lactate dehydrogenase
MSSEPVSPTRIAIIGAGHVGATLAYALLLSGLASEIVLIDQNRARAEGEVDDLNDGVLFTSTARVRAGGVEECAGAAVTVITAGAGQHPGQKRLDLVEQNGAIVRELVPEIVRRNPAGLIVVATNPVDVMSYAAWRLSGLKPPQVIGTGTILDSARFRRRLAARFDVDPHSVHALIIGEHGDSEVPVWSRVTIAGMTLGELGAASGHDADEQQLQELFRSTRDAAYGIIAQKGATYYAIAAGIVRLLEAIIRDQKTVLPVSTLIDGYYGVDDIYLSLPSVIGRSGVHQVLHLTLSDAEAEALRGSAASIRAAWERIEGTMR